MPKTQKRSGPGIFPVRQNGITSFRTPRCTKICRCVYFWNLSDFLLHSINSAFHSPANSLRVSCTSPIFPISRSPTVALEFYAVAPHAGHLGFSFSRRTKKYLACTPDCARYRVILRGPMFAQHRVYWRERKNLAGEKPPTKRKNTTNSECIPCSPRQILRKGLRPLEKCGAMGFLRWRTEPVQKPARGHYQFLCVLKGQKWAQLARISLCSCCGPVAPTPNFFWPLVHFGQPLLFFLLFSFPFPCSTSDKLSVLVCPIAHV